MVSRSTERVAVTMAATMGRRGKIRTGVRDAEASAITVMNAGAGRLCQHAQKEAWVSGAALELIEDVLVIAMRPIATAEKVCATQTKGK